MKKVITYIILGLVIISLPISLLVGGFLTPAVFDESYYGELYYMYDRLKSVEGKKLVLLGTSNIAFGFDIDKMQEAFENDNQSEKLDYTICSFGLYGALGTKIMLDLSRKYISKDDIVIFAPEYINQDLSLYFSNEHAWKAMDGHYEMLMDLPYENNKSMIGYYPLFVGEKYSYLKDNKKALSDGVYNRSSFNENCNMTYDREYNMMYDYFDSNGLIRLNEDIFEQDFIDYVNDYAKEIEKKGASIYFAYCPMNSSSFEASYTEEDFKAFSKFIKDNFDFKVIGNINDYVLDYDWFYDSNVHLNSSGAILRSKQLIDDLKTTLGISSKTKIDIPNKPNIPYNPDIDMQGDNSFEDCFTYRYDQNNDAYIISGTTEIVNDKTEIIIPCAHEGKVIRSIDKNALSNCSNLVKITIQKNIKALNDDIFVGCNNLKQIILKHTSPSQLSVGADLLNGTINCIIYVGDKDILSLFRNNYFWGHYSDSLASI